MLYTIADVRDGVNGFWDIAKEKMKMENERKCRLAPCKNT